MDEVKDEVTTLDGDIVFTLTLTKLEPECVNYGYRIVQKYHPNRPESVEQLEMAKSIIQGALKDSRRLALLEYLRTSRDVRRRMLAERELAPPKSDDPS